MKFGGKLFILSPLLSITKVATSTTSINSIRMFSSSATHDKLTENSLVTFINSDIAKLIDVKLMDNPGFSIDQLMELAGLSVATAVDHFYNSHIVSQDINSDKTFAIFCGPGNNGGDGLVAARHLKHFGYNPTVIYPKRGKTALFNNLVHQCEQLDISIVEVMDENTYSSQQLVVDALFGFSFEGTPREPFASMIRKFATSAVPVLSVDIPSGWNVNEGDVDNSGFSPEATISLSLPKLCMRGYEGVHFIGGRFIPPSLANELQLQMPDYGAGARQIALVTSAEPTVCSDKEQQDHLQVSVMYATAASEEEARTISKALVMRHLAACVSLVPGIESWYEWEGNVEQSREVLLMIKTTKSQVTAVSDVIKELHSYTLPESIALDVVGGSAAYLDWVRKGVGKNSVSR